MPACVLTLHGFRASGDVVSDLGGVACLVGRTSAVQGLLLMPLPIRYVWGCFAWVRSDTKLRPPTAEIRAAPWNLGPDRGIDEGRSAASFTRHLQSVNAFPQHWPMWLRATCSVLCALCSVLCALCSECFLVLFIAATAAYKITQSYIFLLKTKPPKA